MTTQSIEGAMPPLPEPAWWLSHDVLTKRNRIDKMPVQSLQPYVYQHTKLYTEDQVKALLVEHSKASNVHKLVNAINRLLEAVPVYLANGKPTIPDTTMAVVNAALAAHKEQP